MIKTPSPATLKKYGLSEAEWRKHLEDQDGVCYVCEKVPGTGRLCIDHEHVKSWKQMPPEQRKLFVRGLLCWVCNAHYLFRGMTIRKATRVSEYLTKYEIRKPK